MTWYNKTIAQKIEVEFEPILDSENLLLKFRCSFEKQYAKTLLYEQTIPEIDFLSRLQLNIT